MDSLTTTGISACVVAIALVAFVLQRLKKPSHPPYPPGPRGLPILGNIFNIPRNSEWVTYDKWCKELGSDIIYVRAGGNDMIILNSFEAINDLLEQHSSIYSSRPRLPMTIELMECDWVFAMLPYGQVWKARRRLFSKYFHPVNLEYYQSNQLKFAYSILPGLLNTPEEFLKVFQYAINGSALSLSYGIPIQKTNDPYINLAQETIKTMADSSSPGKYLVNLIPALKYVPEFFPGAGFKTKAREFKILTQRFLSEPFNAVVMAMDAGTTHPSLALSALQDLAQCDMNEMQGARKVIMDTAATAFAGAADTVLAAVKCFIAAMLLSPETQRKAQKELDHVLTGRLPDFNDQSSLPYINAIVKEVLRWGVVAPIAIPHVASESNVYRGYYIPKGSIIVPNSWALLRDENRYGPDTSTFRPERFMAGNQLNAEVQDPSLFAFGYGRRVCPGRHIALPFLFLIVATVLSNFDISEELDEKGMPIEPEIKWNPGVITVPRPFKCTIKPRSREAENLIRSLEIETM